jgi:hypothetical protein
LLGHRLGLSRDFDRTLTRAGAALTVCSFCRIMEGTKGEEQESVLDKVELVEQRYEELNRLMADPAVATDHVKVTEYAQEQSEITDLVMAYRRYTDADPAPAP